MNFEQSLSVPEAFSGERLQRHVATAKTLLITGFEWFGELGMFCARLFRAALLPPCSRLNA